MVDAFCEPRTGGKAMKATMFALATLILLVGCQASKFHTADPVGNGPGGVGYESHLGHDSSGPLGLGLLSKLSEHNRRGADFTPRGQGLPDDLMTGGATPTVTYPYYTVRGPRDFLAKNPPSLGP